MNRRESPHGPSWPTVLSLRLNTAAVPFFLQCGREPSKVISPSTSGLNLLHTWWILKVLRISWGVLFEGRVTEPLPEGKNIDRDRKRMISSLFIFLTVETLLSSLNTETSADRSSRIRWKGGSDISTTALDRFFWGGVESSKVSYFGGTYKRFGVSWIPRRALPDIRDGIWKEEF